ncbi:retinol dehydrogenase 12-like [Vanessa atalanta]|uniref:retinol dehydrogenase 12-like n=1 Tax=Vanessa atalanta TaxID=42275 RepID=UPI001FCD0F97|nr:retinol dehydrogenase 12-like [Vanessa atalanta]
MSLLITSAAITITIASAIYWYINRHKPIKHILSELRYTIDMQGAGAGGLIDDWVSVWINKIELPDASNKIAVITGGARGIGTEVVRGLLKANMTVIMGVRNPNSVEKFIETMENGKRIRAFPLDLLSLESVKKFADSVLKEFPEIHLLVNNAGIMFGDYKLTKDGFETQLAVNHLSHFYLTHLLLPALKRSGRMEEPSRVVNVSSCAHFPGKIYFDDINMKEHYDTTAAYAQSKLAQLMTARHINKLLEDKDCPVKCYSVHPGIVDTDLFEKTNFSSLPWLRRMLFKTPEKGAVSILYACFNKDILAKGGLYISNCKEGFSNRFSKNEKHQEKLFQLSCDLVGIQEQNFGRN